MKRRDPRLRPEPGDSVEPTRGSADSQTTELLEVSALETGSGPEPRRNRCLRATDSEWKAIKERAHQAGYTRTAYILKSALEGRPRARPGQPTQDAIYHLARIGNNLNQLARAANTPTRLVESGRIDETLERVVAWIEAHI